MVKSNSKKYEETKAPFTRARGNFHWTEKFFTHVTCSHKTISADFVTDRSTVYTSIYKFLHTAVQKLAWFRRFRVYGVLMTYIMARILGEENISCSASSTWLIPTNAVPFFFERESAISTALRHISRHRRASPDTAATYEAQMVNINIKILHSNPKRKIKRYRKDKFQSNSFETLQLQRC